MTKLPARLKPWLPGVAVSAVVALSAMFLSEHYGAPVMLFALLLGMALNFLTQEEGAGEHRRASRSAAGIDLVAKQVLRLGVALLGLRITADQVVALGWQPVCMVVLAVVLTIVFGELLARLMGYPKFFGVLTGGAVGICGASAALALSAALPGHRRKEEATLLTVIGVSALSTLAMVVYPMLTRALDMPPMLAGFFIGGTIHDVAQVVGAGYSLSHEAGDAATLVKLMRVAMLLPVIALAAWLARRHELSQGAEASGPRPPLLPWFAVAFAVLVAVNSTGWLPLAVVNAGKSASQWCLVAAMAAIGMKTHLKDVLTLGWKPVLLMVAETVFLAVLFYTLLRLTPLSG